MVHLFQRVIEDKQNIHVLISMYRKKLIIKKALRGNPLFCLTTMYDRSVIGDLFFDETYNRHEDYIFWLTILKRGIVAKGNLKVLATYVIHSNSKNSNKSKLVKAMYRVYHEYQGFNWLKSWIHVFRYALYSKKMHKSVRKQIMIIRS